LPETTSSKNYETQAIREINRPRLRRRLNSAATMAPVSCAICFHVSISMSASHYCVLSFIFETSKNCVFRLAKRRKIANSSVEETLF